MKHVGKHLMSSVGNGNLPVVEFNEQIYESDVDDVEKGMRAKLIDVGNEEDGSYQLTFDLKGFEVFNNNFEKPIYADKSGNYTLKWSETIFYPKNGIYTTYLYDGFDSFFDFVDDMSLYNEYINSNSGYSYVRWLEEKVINLSN